MRLEKSGEDADTESLFAEVWGRGQPVVVGEVNSRLDAALWQPSCFARKEIPIPVESVLERYKEVSAVQLFCLRPLASRRPSSRFGNLAEVPWVKVQKVQKFG